MLMYSGSADAASGDSEVAPEGSRVACSIFSLPERQSEVFKMLIGQVGKDRAINAAAKRWAYSDMPSFSSQSPICRITAPSDLPLSVPDRQDRNSTTRADLLQCPQRGVHLRTGGTFDRRCRFRVLFDVCFFPESDLVTARQRNDAKGQQATSVSDASPNSAAGLRR